MRAFSRTGVELNLYCKLKMVEAQLLSQRHFSTNHFDYRLDKVIGSGSFGLVWKATCIHKPNDGKIVAIKILDLE